MGLLVFQWLKPSCPEIIPCAYHSAVLYEDRKDLVAKLLDRIINFSDCQVLRRDLPGEIGRFAWENLIDQYDQVLEDLTK
jgi:hypothetical protein